MAKRRFYKRKYRSLVAAGSLSLFIFFLTGLIDNVVGGWMLGEIALSAISLAMPFFTLIVFFGKLVGAGTAAVYSLECGRFHEQRAHRVFGQGVVLALASGAVMSVILFLGRSSFLHFFRASANIFDQASAYYSNFCWIALVYPLYQVGYNMVYNDGDEQLCVLSDVVQIAVNTVASVLLTPRFGISGLSIGTLVGIIGGLLVLCIHAFRPSNSIRFSLGFCGEDLKNMFSNGLAASFSSLLTAILTMYLSRLIVSHFTEYLLPVYSVVQMFVDFAGIFGGVGMAIGPLVSIYYGEMNAKGIQNVMRSAMNTAILEGLAVTVLVEIFADFIPQIYGITTPVFIIVAAKALRIIAPFMVVLSILYLYASYYSIVDNNMLSLLLTLIVTFVAPLSLSYLLQMWVGFDGLWIAYGLSPLVALIVGVIFLRTAKKNYSFPYALPAPTRSIYNFDVLLSEQTVVDLRDQIEKILVQYSISRHTIHSIMLAIEELSLLVMEKNAGHTVCAEYSLSVGKEIRLTCRDDGILFDITEENGPIGSLRSFMVACMMEKQREKLYLITTSYNRNSFEFTIKSDGVNTTITK